MKRFLALIVCAALGAMTLGCNEQAEITPANVTGTWSAPFADVTAVLTLAPDGRFLLERDGPGGNSSQLFSVTAWGRLAESGQWELIEDEINFSGRLGTTGGLIIARLEPNQMLLKASDGSVMYFRRVATRTLPAPQPMPNFQPGEGEGEELDDFDFDD